MLEIIITGRHDDYGGEDFLDRWCAAANHNHRLLTACGVEHRFTLAEWNPVEGRTLLADLIRDRLPWWHQYLVVDREWHQALSTNPRLQFMEFFAKNAAVRRSTADIILTTNSDVFLSTEVAKALAAARTYDDRVVYRATRIDIDRRVDWRTCGEATFADPRRQLRTNDLQPPCYSNSAGDFLLLTPKAWLALGGFNERVRFAKIHKDGQFCINAWLEGYTFESLGPIYHIDHDGSYANAGAMLGSPDAPYGPEWDYHNRYRNPASWGVSAGIDEAAGGGVVHVHHPSTHGELLTVIEVAEGAARTQEGAARTQEGSCHKGSCHGDNSMSVARTLSGPCDMHEDHSMSVARTLVGPCNRDSLATRVNAALATATGKFVVVTADPQLGAFGGREALEAALEETAAALIAPAGSLAPHSSLGLVPTDGAPYVMRRDVVDALTEWDELEPDPALAFWLRAMEGREIAEIGSPSAGERLLPARIRPSLETTALTRRGLPVQRPLLDRAIGEYLVTARDLQTLVARWIDAVIPPETGAPIAIVGPDWATPLLLEGLAAGERTLIGVFTALANEEGTVRWGERLRPIAELSLAPVALVLAGADVRLKDRLAAMGCRASVHVISEVHDASQVKADAELDGLRRAQARDLAATNITQVLPRLPLLSLLEGERGWGHRYDAGQACERAGRAATALELYKEVVADCATDLGLSMRAAFHTARLLVDRGAFYQAAPLLSKILKHNSAHRAARQLLDQITTNRELSA